MSDFEIKVVGKNAPRARRRKRQPRRPEIIQPKRSALRIAARVLWFIAKPRSGTWTVGALVFVVVAFGTPHLLISAQCSGYGTRVQRCTHCNYLGVQGFRLLPDKNWQCPMVAMVSVDWAALSFHFQSPQSIRP